MMFFDGRMVSSFIIIQVSTGRKQRKLLPERFDFCLLSPFHGTSRLRTSSACSFTCPRRFSGPQTPDTNWIRPRFLLTASIVWSAVNRSAVVINDIHSSWGEAEGGHVWVCWTKDKGSKVGSPPDLLQMEEKQPLQSSCSGRKQLRRGKRFG